MALPILEPLTSQRLPEGSGNITVNANLTDIAGNPATQQTITLSLDKTAPSVNSIVIDGGAYDNDGSVNLTLSSTDTNSLQMKYLTQRTVLPVLTRPMLPQRQAGLMVSPMAQQLSRSCIVMQRVTKVPV